MDVDAAVLWNAPEPSLGRIWPKAITTITSAIQLLYSLDKDSGSFRTFTGWYTGILYSRACLLHRRHLNCAFPCPLVYPAGSPPRPPSCPASTSASSAGTEKSGVPINTIRMIYTFLPDVPSFTPPPLSPLRRHPRPPARPPRYPRRARPLRWAISWQMARASSPSPSSS